MAKAKTTKIARLTAALKKQALTQRQMVTRFGYASEKATSGRLTELKEQYKLSVRPNTSGRMQYRITGTV